MKTTDKTRRELLHLLCRLRPPPRDRAICPDERCVWNHRKLTGEAVCPFGRCRQGGDDDAGVKKCET